VIGIEQFVIDDFGEDVVLSREGHQFVELVEDEGDELLAVEAAAPSTCSQLSTTNRRC
jgi:hypothetical protein